MMNDGEKGHTATRHAGPEGGRERPQKPGIRCTCSYKYRFLDIPDTPCMPYMPYIGVVWGVNVGIYGIDRVYGYDTF